jgi:nucleotide-binding universal stress UspA family protein
VALVAWNASREATRAAHDALPFLHAAERVVLCAIGDPATADPGLEDAAAMLDRHGVAVQVEQVPGPDSGTGVGEALLARAAEHGADLLVMGAYGHSRLREFVLGGTTRRVLREATLPVLFSS